MNFSGDVDEQRFCDFCGLDNYMENPTMCEYPNCGGGRGINGPVIGSRTGCDECVKIVYGTEFGYCWAHWPTDEVSDLADGVHGDEIWDDAPESTRRHWPAVRPSDVDDPRAGKCACTVSPRELATYFELLAAPPAAPAGPPRSGTAGQPMGNHPS